MQVCEQVPPGGTALLVITQSEEECSRQQACHVLLRHFHQSLSSEAGCQDRIPLAHVVWQEGWEKDVWPRPSTKPCKLHHCGAKWRARLLHTCTPMKARTRLGGLASEPLPAPPARCASNPCAAWPPRSRRPSARLCGSSSCDVAAALKRYRHAKPSRDRTASADARYAPAFIHEAASNSTSLHGHECTWKTPFSVFFLSFPSQSTSRLWHSSKPQPIKSAGPAPVSQRLHVHSTRTGAQLRDLRASGSQHSVERSRDGAPAHLREATACQPHIGRHGPPPRAARGRAACASMRPRARCPRRTRRRR